ncbi:class I SAM-dependent methyltransferase [Candidatus Nitrosopelagicus sp.]|nr:class I SAM-dependent methyltransferase [Candidatus Nitrosopelagicus sp.]
MTIKSHQGKILKQKSGYKIIDCKFCKFIHVIPLPTKIELSQHYTKNYYKKIKPNYIKKYKNELPYWNLIFDEKLDFLSSKIKTKTKSIFDLGSGSGYFLKRAKEKGWKVDGIEPNLIAANHSKKIGIPVINDFFENLNIDDMKKVNAINLFDVLEHVHNPIELLKNCHKLLRSKGIIVIEIPNDYNPLQKIVQQSLKKEEYWLTLLTKSRNYHWSSKMDHINYFNFLSLRKLLKKLQFNIIYEQSTFPLELFLLMGDDYLKNEKIGKDIHQKRMIMEKNLMNNKNQELKKNLYEKFAQLGIGRTAIFFAQKI